MSAKEQNADKKEWTEEERLALAAKLDAELDEFIDGLEKTRYTEGWPEDRWQEEMDKHPFFMKREPQPGDEVHPMFEGLQKLKYDPEENTNDELAANYKEDGNFYMKHKKYRMAIYSYSEGIKTKCEDAVLMSQLYNNRSAANFFLQNFRSALADAIKACESRPNYQKAQLRAAEAAMNLNKFDVCQDMCAKVLDNEPDNVKARQLLQMSKEKKLQTERNARKEDVKRRKQLKQFQLLCNKLKERKVKFDDQPQGQQELSEELLKPKFLPIEEHMVHLDEGDTQLGTLVWPAAFSYPEFLISDFHQQLSENVVLQELLDEMFAEPMQYDTHFHYRADNLSIYYENRKTGTLHKVNAEKNIKDILSEEHFYVSGGTLLFYVVPKESTIEQAFLQQTRRPLVYDK